MILLNKLVNTFNLTKHIKSHVSWVAFTGYSKEKETFGKKQQMPIAKNLCDRTKIPF